MAQEVLQVIGVELLAAQDRAAEGATLAVDVLGCGVDDDVGTELERVLEHRRGEHIVNDDESIGGVGEFAHRGEVDDLETRVRRGFEEDRLGPTRKGGFPLVEVAPVDEHGLDAVAREDVGDDHRTAPEQGPRGNDLVTSRQERSHRGEHRRHTARGDPADLGALEQAQTLLEHRDGRVSVAAVDVAISVTRKAAWASSAEL